MSVLAADGLPSEVRKEILLQSRDLYFSRVRPSCPSTLRRVPALQMSCIPLSFEESGVSTTKCSLGTTD